ncbi:hypothetical protein PSACC_00735 [Paramicrosporidium saccamoebae]|uniref:P-loop containing nucleoside triphosphate hydrolase protein n=1 Tax=Paramicrosporidium saccamoebae TaxID=1246581 RepID=A0A2H9TNY9_9FUNG|nr:hypothetical protein PSACC_00735 [Paramicrosporidium saccamoebae]
MDGYLHVRWWKEGEITRVVGPENERGPPVPWHKFLFFETIFRGYKIAHKIFGIPLRPYQEDCIQVCLDEYAKGVRRQAVSLPVGSGKTVLFSLVNYILQVVFANLISRLPQLKSGANKVLVLAHREELLIQAQRQIQRVAPHLKVAIERGRYWSNHEDDDVIIASVPTLGRSDSAARLERFDFKSFKAIIVDEAHHSVADTYLRIMRHFRVISQDGSRPESEALVWGCSATFRRNDELVLGSVFEKIIYHVDIATLMNEGFLCRVETKEIYTDIDLCKVKMIRGDFEMRELSLAIDTPVRNELVAAMWDEIANKKNAKKATIVFALTVEHARNLAAAFGELGTRTALITGETNESTRKAILAQFCAGEIPVLLNCAVLTEGTDLPITDCIVMTRPTCNSSLYIQMVGRGLRMHDGKQSCLVLDFIDKIRSKNRSLITFPSLFAAKQEYETGEREGDCESKPKYRPGEVDPSKISIKVQSKSLHEQPASSPGFGLAWILLDSDHFALATRSGNYVLELDPENRGRGKLLSVEKCRTPIPSLRKSRVYYETEAISKEWCPVHEIVPQLITRLEDEGNIDSVRVDAYWRRIAPLTPNQKSLLFKVLVQIPGIDSSCLAQVHSWSVGRASDLITKYYLRYRLLKRPFENFKDYISGVETYK